SGALTEEGHTDLERLERRIRRLDAGDVRGPVGSRVQTRRVEDRVTRVDPDRFPGRPLWRVARGARPPRIPRRRATPVRHRPQVIATFPPRRRPVPLRLA